MFFELKILRLRKILSSRGRGLLRAPSSECFFSLEAENVSLTEDEPKGLSPVVLAERQFVDSALLERGVDLPDLRDIVLLVAPVPPELGHRRFHPSDAVRHHQDRLQRTFVVAVPASTQVDVGMNDLRQSVGALLGTSGQERVDLRNFREDLRQRHVVGVSELLDRPVLEHVHEFGGARVRLEIAQACIRVDVHALAVAVEHCLSGRDRLRCGGRHHCIDFVALFTKGMTALGGALGTLGRERLFRRGGEVLVAGEENRHVRNMVSHLGLLVGTVKSLTILSRLSGFRNPPAVVWLLSA